MAAGVREPSGSHPLDRPQYGTGDRGMAGNGRRGFASMDAEERREIARKGGRAAHEKGTSHEFTPEEAREAGRKGGTVVSRDRRHMAEIGREGGRSRNGSGHRPARNGTSH